MKSKTNREEFRPYHLQWYTAIKPSYLCSKPTTNCVFKKLTKKTKHSNNFPLSYIAKVLFGKFRNNRKEKKMTTIKERKKSRRKQFQIQISKHLMGLKVWFGVQQINIKNLGSTNISGLKNWIWSYFPFFVMKNVFDKILMKKSPIVLPLPFLPEF